MPVNGALTSHLQDRLYFAILQDDLKQIKLILANGADPATPGLIAPTKPPVYAAAEVGQRRALQVLLAAGADPNAIDTRTRQTATTIAAMNSHIGVVNVLLRNNADPNKSGADCWGPLARATYNGHVLIVRDLLEHGANPNQAEEKNGSTAVFIAAQLGNAEVVKLLLQYNANLDQTTYKGFAPVQVASHYGHVSVVTMLLEHGANPNTRSLFQNNTGSNGRTAMYLAAANGLDDVVRVLLQHNADPNQSMSRREGVTSNFSPAHIAAYNGHRGVIEVLMEHDATDPNVVTTDDRQFTPMIVAALCGHSKIVEVLLRRKANPLRVAFVRVTEKHPFTNAMLAAVSGNHRDVVDILLQHNVSTTMPGGEDALFVASQSGSAKVVAVLLKHGADPNQHNAIAPLFVAAQGTH